MISFLNSFFKPRRSRYSYPLRFDDAKKKIEQIIASNVSLWNTKDISGKFLDDSTFYFQLETAPFWIGPTLNSDLTGRITKISESSVDIKVEIRSSIFLFGLFFIFFIVGFIVLVFGLIHLNGQQIISGTLFSILGPGFCIWLGNMINSTLQDRYLLYINKALRI